jgi:hypothetical protein
MQTSKPIDQATKAWWKELGRTGDIRKADLKKAQVKKYYDRLKNVLELPFNK